MQDCESQQIQARLPELLRWVEEMPSAFRAMPASDRDSGLHVDAVLCDLFEAMGWPRPDKQILAVCRPVRARPESMRHARWILASAHLMACPALRSCGPDPQRLTALLSTELAELASHHDIDALDDAQERREELVRRVLRALEMRLPDESSEVAEDRLRQIDTVVRAKVLAQAEERERRAREVRAAMRRRAAEEAAAKVCRE